MILVHKKEFTADSKNPFLKTLMLMSLDDVFLMFIKLRFTMLGVSVFSIS